MSESMYKNDELENEVSLDLSYFWYSDIEKIDYHQAELDPSLFIGPDMVHFNHVVDSAFIGCDKAKTGTMITDLSTELDPACEGDLMASNGIKSQSLLSRIE